jgi:hypothetical protein
LRAPTTSRMARRCPLATVSPTRKMGSAKIFCFCRRGRRNQFKSNALTPSAIPPPPFYLL